MTLASEFCNNIRSRQRCVHLPSSYHSSTLPEIIRMLIDIKAQEGGSAASFTKCSAGLSKRRGLGGGFFFFMHWRQKPGTSSLIASVLSLTCDSLPLMHASHRRSYCETLHPAARRGLRGVMGSLRSSAQVLLLCIVSAHQAEIDAPSIIILIFLAIIGEPCTLLCLRTNVGLPLQLCGLQSRLHLLIIPANVHRG